MQILSENAGGHVQPQGLQLALAQAGGQASSSSVAALEALGSAVSLHKGEELYAQDDKAQYSYRVMRGCLRLVKLMEDGRRQVTEFLVPGDWLGLEAAERVDCGAEAVTACVIRRYPLRGLEALMTADRPLALWRLNHLSKKLGIAQERMLTLGRRTAAERIAGFLLEMEQRMPRGRDDAVPLPMNRGDIGDHLGLTVETVSRSLTRLEQDRMIGRAGSGFMVLDRANLRAWASATRH